MDESIWSIEVCSCNAIATFKSLLQIWTTVSTTKYVHTHADTYKHVDKIHSLSTNIKHHADKHEAKDISIWKNTRNYISYFYGNNTEILSQRLTGV